MPSISPILSIVGAILLIASLFVFQGGDTMTQIVNGTLTACGGLVMVALGVILKSIEQR